MLILGIVSFFARKKIVVLEDFEGEFYFTLERVSPFGKKFAYVYWLSRLGFVVLNEDGTCSTNSSSFIKRWKYFNQ